LKKTGRQAGEMLNIGFSGKTGFLKRSSFKEKCSCLGVKISTTKATWNVKFVGFNDTNISNARENVD
jgi:hypothetical protein